MAIEIHFPQRRIDEGESVPYRLDIFASPAQGNVFVDGSHEPAGNFGGRVVINRFGAETGDAIEGRRDAGDAFEGRRDAGDAFEVR